MELHSLLAQLATTEVWLDKIKKRTVEVGVGDIAEKEEEVRRAFEAGTAVLFPCMRFYG